MLLHVSVFHNRDWDCGFESRRWHGCLSFVSVVCCQVEVSASGRSLVQRSPTECGVSECEQQPTKGYWATRGGDDFTFYTSNLTEAVTNSQIQTSHVIVTRTRLLQYRDAKGISESEEVKSNGRLSNGRTCSCLYRIWSDHICVFPNYAVTNLPQDGRINP